MNICANPIASHAIEDDAVIDKLRKAIEEDNIRITDESLQYMRRKTKERMMKWKKVGITEMQELFTIASESAAVMKKLDKETKIKNKLEKMLEEEELALVEQRPQTQLKRYLERIQKEKMEEMEKQAARKKQIESKERSQGNALNIKQESDEAQKTEKIIEDSKDEDKKIEKDSKLINEVSNLKITDESKDIKDVKNEKQDVKKFAVQTTQQKNIFSKFTQPQSSPQNNQQSESKQKSLFSIEPNKQQVNNISSNQMSSFNIGFSSSGSNSNFLSSAKDANFAGVKKQASPSSNNQTIKANPFLNTGNSQPTVNFMNTNAQKPSNLFETKTNQKTTSAQPKVNSKLASFSESGSLFNFASAPEKATEIKKEPSFFNSLSTKPNPLFGKPESDSVLKSFKPAESVSIFKVTQPSAFSIFSQNPPKPTP